MSSSSSSSLQLLPEEEEDSVDLTSVPESRVSRLIAPLVSRNGSQQDLIKFGVALVLSEPWGSGTAKLLSVVPEGSLDVELLQCSLNGNMEVPKDGEFSSIRDESVETASAQGVSESPEPTELLLLILRWKVLACLCFS